MARISGVLGAIALLVCATASNASAAGPDFAAAVNYSVGTGPVSVARAELNADGKLDLVTANRDSNDVSVLMGNGDGTFDAAVQYAVADASSPNAVAIGDLNADAKPDLAVAALLANKVYVLLGAGDGTFGSATGFDTGTDSFPAAVAIADLNANGKPDLAVGAMGAGKVAVLLGNGNGTFQAHVDYTAGSPGSLAVGDLNGDSKPDIAAAGQDSNVISVLLGAGDGTFGAAATFGTGDFPQSMALTDLNSDGKLDAVTANNTSGNVSVLLGNGNGTFQSKADYTTGTNTTSVAAGDLDGDGHPDVAATNASDSNVSLLMGAGNGTLGAAVDHDVGVFPMSVTIGDLNGDSRPDLAAANSGGIANPADSKVSVLLQEATVGPLDHFKVEKAGGGTIGTQTAGAAFTVKITAQDASNNTVTSFTGTVALSSNRTCSAGCGTTPAFSAGVLASRSVTLTKAGSGATLTATGSSKTGTSNSFTVNPAALHHFKVEKAGGGAIGTQVAGTAFNVRVTAQDQFNNTQTGFAGTVNMTSNRTCSAGCGTTPALSAGVLASRSMKLTKSGTGATVTATGSSKTGTSNAFTVNPAAASKLVFTSSTASLKVGQSRTLTAEVRDAFGNKVPSPAKVVTFAKASGAGNVSGLGSATSSAGVAAKTVKATAVGAITIKATATGLTQGTTTFTITT